MTAPAILRVRDQPVAKAAFPVWGGTAELLVTDPRAIGEGERRLAAELDAVGAACSRFRADSELSAVNAAAGEAVCVSALFLEFLDAALRAAATTSGAVDPTCGAALVRLGYDRDFTELRRARPAARGHHAAAGDAAASPEPAELPPTERGPGRHRAPVSEVCAVAEDEPYGVADLPAPVPGWRVVEADRALGTVRVPAGVGLDFGATAKAHAADRAAWLLARELGCGVLVNLSGDVSVAGPPPPGGWPIRAADGEATGPTDPGQTITLHDGGAATSGTTVRTWQHGARIVHHIVDPATGASAAAPWLTVTAVAGSCLDANTLTTAALVRGLEILPFLRQAGCPMRLLGADGRITLLGGWPQEDLR